VAACAETWLQWKQRRPLKDDGLVSCAMFTIEFSESVALDLADLRAFDRNQILDQIDRQLSHEPTTQARNKKKLMGLIPPWEHVGPVWELRVNEFRVFYEVEEEAARSLIRAIRHKPPHKTIGEIL
jgi:mRNA-degrading endonuclease RelE of RelBE toxin-antitoxin system